MLPAKAKNPKNSHSPSGNESLKKIKNLMKKYADLPMDFADATIVCLATETGMHNVVTFDKKDFAIYKSAKIKVSDRGIKFDKGGIGQADKHRCASGFMINYKVVFMFIGRRYINRFAPGSWRCRYGLELSLF